MTVFKNLKTSPIVGFIPITLFFCLLSSFLAGQTEKIIKKTKKADILFQNAITYGDSAIYDSAVILFKKASIIYKKRKAYEKYILCKNEIISQSRNLKFNDELLNSAKENIIYSTKILGKEHYLTGKTYSILGNIYADIKNNDSALHYFSKGKEIWESEHKKNKMEIARANLNIGQMHSGKKEFEKAFVFLHKALKYKADSGEINFSFLGKVYNSLGALYYYKDEMDSCVFYFTKRLINSKNQYGESHPKVADAYLNVGAAYNSKGDYDNALKVYLKSADIREKNNDLMHPRMAMVYNNIGINYGDLGKFKLEREYYEKALKIRLQLLDENHYDLASSYNNIAGNCASLGEPGSVLLNLQKALKIIINIYGPDNPNCAYLYNNIGYSYADLGDIDKALFYYKKGMELRLKISKNYHELESSYNNIGTAYKTKGDYELALSYFKSGLKIHTNNFNEPNETEAILYNNIGTVYLSLNKLDQALEYFNKALKIRTKLFGDNFSEIATLFHNIGLTYQKRNDLEKEKESYEKGIDICLNNFNENNIHITKLYRSLALNKAKRNDYKGAIALLEKTLKIQLVSFSDNHPAVSETLNGIAKVHSQFGNYNLSNTYYLKSLDANYIGEISENPEFYLIPDDVQFLETLSELADLHFKKYKTTNDNKSLPEAIKYYQKASEMISFLVSDLYVEDSKLNIMKKSTEILERAVTASEILYQKEKIHKTIELAFNFSEQNKSSVLYESIIRSNINDERTSDSLWVLQQDLSGKINYLKTKILTKANGTSDIKNKYGEELSQAIIDYQKVTEKIRSKKANKKHNVSYKHTFINSIQSNLNTEEVMLEYFFSDSAVYCFVIGKQILELKEVHIEADFRDQLYNYITGIKKHRLNQFQDNSLYLYNKLIKPVEKYLTGKSKLIIVPDGHLLYLPFGSLISQKNNTNQNLDFSKLNYLIKDYEIVYQYSANLWLDNKEHGEINNDLKGFLGVAPFSSKEIINEIDSTNLSFLDSSLSESVLRSITNSKNEFKPLPFSGKEITNIAGLFALQNKKTKNLIKNEASEKNLKIFAGDYKYLHIATHGIINNIHPELSGLALIKDNSQEESSDDNKKDWKFEQNTDGILYAKEIFDLDLNADIVVLSACETGIGKLEKGEGIISLTRGFLYNRVPNIVFSLWKINDKNTCDLMTDFYKNFLQGKSYSSALRQAKLNMIKNKETAYPGNWAAFSLIGK